PDARPTPHSDAGFAVARSPDRGAGLHRPPDHSAASSARAGPDRADTLSRSSGTVRFEVRVQPRASRTELAGMHGGALKIRIAAPPVDDAANRALVEFLAECLGLAKRAVRIVAGASSRTKILEADGVTPAQIAALGDRALR